MFIQKYASLTYTLLPTTTEIIRDNGKEDDRGTSMQRTCLKDHSVYFNSKGFCRSLLIFFVIFILYLIVHPTLLPQLSDRMPKVLKSYTYIDTVPSKSRFALCISGGHVESLFLEEIYSAFLSNAIDERETDIFIYGQTSRRITKDGPTVSNETFEINRLTNIFGSRLKSFVISDGTELLEEEEVLLNRSNTGTEWRHTRFKRTIPMFLKINKCQKGLIEPFELNQGRRYEIVGRSRPDFILHSKVEPPLNYALNTIYFPGIKVDSGLLLWPGENNTLGVADPFFFGSGNAMALVSEAIYFLTSALPKEGNIFGESLLKYVVVDLLKLKTSWIPNTPVTLYRE